MKHISSAGMTESHFDQKAHRYIRALEFAPDARILELVPFFILLQKHLGRDSKKLKLADLLCGSGFLTKAFSSCFKETVGIDVSSKMLQQYPSGDKTSSIHASIDEQAEELKKIQPDVIVSLAGLHHVYSVGDGNEIQNRDSTKMQIELIKGWAEALAPDGIAIIADITTSQVPARFYSNQGKLMLENDALGIQLKKLTDKSCFFKNYPFDFNSEFSISDFVNFISTTTDCNPAASPAEWFRGFVAKKSIYGHEDHFVYPRNILAGITNTHEITYHEFPTPWIFESKNHFKNFFYDKFCLGEEPFNQVKEPVLSNMQDATLNYLRGPKELKSGMQSVGWRLGFYLIKSNR